MKKNNLVVYYTHSANTRSIAEMINKQVEGTIFEIIPTVPYPTGYDDVVKQAKKEINAGYLPELASDLDIKPYDVIFVGTPNWHGTLAPPVAAFLQAHDFAGKIVVPFCTHGGGGMAHIQRDVEKLCPGAQVLTGAGVYGSGGSGAASAVEKWLKQIL